MPLPTTNLTLHIDASDTDKLFTSTVGGVHSGVPADGGEVIVWDDEGDGIANVAWHTPGATGAFYRSATPLMELPCVNFDPLEASTYSLMTENAGASIAASSILAAGAKTILVAFRAEGATANAAQPTSNHVLIGSVGGYWSVSVRTNGTGGYFLQFYNYDGGIDFVEKEISLDTSYVAVCQHDTGNLKLTLITDGEGTESSATPVASGNTESLAEGVGLGFVTSVFYDGCIGELAVYNAVVSGADLTAAKQYFYQKWFPAVAGGSSTLCLLGVG